MRPGGKSMCGRKGCLGRPLNPVCGPGEPRSPPRPTSVPRRSSPGTCMPRTGRRGCSAALDAKPLESEFFPLLELDCPLPSISLRKPTIFLPFLAYLPIWARCLLQNGAQREPWGRCTTLPCRAAAPLSRPVERRVRWVLPVAYHAASKILPIFQGLWRTCGKRSGRATSHAVPSSTNLAPTP